MDSFQIQLGIYDLLSVLVVGFLAICVGWITLRGSTEFLSRVNSLCTQSIILLFLAAIAVGGLAQEIGQVATRPRTGAHAVSVDAIARTSTLPICLA